MIHAAAAGNFDAFAQRKLEQELGFSSIADGAFMSSTCGEDLRFISEEDIARATEGTFLGDYRVRRQLAACSIWGFGVDVGADFQKPVRAEIPTLLISGAVDAVTPPDGAERVAKALPRGRHVIFPNQSHDFANLACEQRIMKDFIVAGSADGVNVRCAAETRRPPFQLDGSERR
jgi:pimeloyl-ACP methyl ester carboxylesterase